MQNKKNIHNHGQNGGHYPDRFGFVLATKKGIKLRQRYKNSKCQNKHKDNVTTFFLEANNNRKLD